MAEQVGQVLFKVGLKGQDGVKQEVTTLGNQISSSSGLGGAFGKLGGIIAAAFSINAILSFSSACREAYDTSIEMQTKLQTIMRQRMNATQDEIESIRELNSELQAIGVVEDDISAAGAQQLSTFLKSSESLETLIPAMQNLVAQQKGFNATTGDAVNVGNLMGKVMQGQTSALTRVGITFTEAQEAVLKYGNEQERAAMLAQVITDNVGNMNEALGNTPQGKMLQMANTWGDIQENIGNILTSCIYPFLDSLSTILNVLNNATTKLAEFAQLWGGLSGQTLPITSSTIGDISEDLETSAEASERMAFSFDNLNKVSGGNSTNITTGNGGNEITNIGNDESIGEKTSELSKIEKFVENIIELVDDLEFIWGDIIDSIELWVDDVIGFFSRLDETIGVYEEDWDDMCKSMKESAGETLEWLEDAWNTTVGVKLNDIDVKIDKIFGPGGTFETSIGQSIEALITMGENCEWLMKLIGILGIVGSTAFGYIFEAGLDGLEFLMKSIAAFLTYWSGIFELIQGITEGNWEKIQDGFSKMIQGMIDEFDAFINHFLNAATFGGVNFIKDAANWASDLGSSFNNNNVSLSGSGGRGESTKSTQNTNRPSSRNQDSRTQVTIPLQLDGNVLTKVIGTINNRNEFVLG